MLLALLAGAILLSLVQPWGQRISRRLRASLAWLGFAVMASIGLLRLAATLAEVIAGDPFRLLHRSPTALMHPLRTDDQHRP